MGTLDEILEKAQQRARESGLPYAGSLTPAEAQQLRDAIPAAKLIDVRTRPELELVGRIPGAFHIEWSFYPDMRPNPEFLAQINDNIDPDALLMFICRTGGRSHNAAAVATQAGYSNCYNVLEGFEGATDPTTGQRGKINGWKVAGLPWTN
jgi:rhodanese-related sulfurtransferase